MTVRERLLGDVSGEFVDGPFGSNLKASEYVDQGVPIIRLQNIRPNRFLEKDIKFVSGAKAAELRRHSYRAGDVVIAKLGAVGTACVVPPSCQDGLIVADVIRFRSDESEVDHRYLSHFLNSKEGKRRVLEFSKGSTRVRTNLSDLRRISIPLPSVTKQRRIAAILDKADALRVKRREAIAKLDQLQRSVFLDMFGDPVMNPKGWHVSKIGNECEVGTGGTPSRSDDTNFEGDIPWVKSTEVNWGRVVKTGEHVSEAGKRAARLKLYPPETVVVALYGQGVTRGKCAVLGVHAAMNQACAGISPSKSVSTSYLFHFLKNSYLRLRDEGRGGNQENLNLGILKSFEIPIPSVALQGKFHSLVASLHELGSKQVIEQEKTSNLFSSLQQRAFSGAL